MTLAVLYEDGDVLVLDKPSGLLVHRGIGRDDVVLVDLVREYTGDTPRPVHRLDRGTSGVILFAKSAAVCAALQAAFQTGHVTKTYVALVRGVAPDDGVIDSAVPRSEGGERVDACTTFRRIEVFETEPRHLSLVEAKPQTGRFHQIRRHLKHINHPIIGDANYGKGALNRAIYERYGLDRLALHASDLELADPVTGDRRHWSAPMPDCLAEPLQRMRSRY